MFEETRRSVEDREIIGRHFTPFEDADEAVAELRFIASTILAFALVDTALDLTHNPDDSLTITLFAFRTAPPIIALVLAGLALCLRLRRSRACAVGLLVAVVARIAMSLPLVPVFLAFPVPIVGGCVWLILSGMLVAMAVRAIQAAHAIHRFGAELSRDPTD